MHAKKKMALVVLAALVLPLIVMPVSHADAATDTFVIDDNTPAVYRDRLADHTYFTIDTKKVIGGDEPVTVTFNMDNGAFLNGAQKSKAYMLGTDIYCFSIEFSKAVQNGAVTLEFNKSNGAFNTSFPHKLALVDINGGVTLDVGTYSNGILKITGASEGQYVMYIPQSDEDPTYEEPEPEDLTNSVAVAVAGAGAFAVLVLVFVLIRKGEI